MQAGKLRQRVTLQTATETANDYGELTRIWADTTTVWASVESLTGREYLQAQQEKISVTTRIVMRYRSGVTTTMRATWDGHTYNIRSVLQDERKTMLTLMCQEVSG